MNILLGGSVIVLAVYMAMFASIIAKETYSYIKSELLPTSPSIVGEAH